MKRLLLILIVLALTAISSSALIEEDPDHTLLWSGFTSATMIDSFAVTTTNEGIVVLKYDTISQTYEAVSHLFLDNRPFMQKRSGNVISVRAEGNILYFIDVSYLPNVTLLGQADLGFPFYDFALFGQDLYICNGFDGLRRYTMVNFGSLTLADSSLIGIHYTAVEIYGNELFALDDYNGIMRYRLTGIGFGSFIDYLYVPRRVTNFTRVDSTLIIATYAPELMIAKIRAEGPVLADTVGLLLPAEHLTAIDTMVVALGENYSLAEIVSLSTHQTIQLQLEKPLHDGLQGTTFAFDGENRFIAPTENGGLILYRLDRLPVDPSSSPVYARPGPVVGIHLFEDKLYTGGLGNPVDIYTLDTDGSPMAQSTLYEGLTSVEAMTLDGGYLATYYPTLQSVIMTNVGDISPWYAGTVFMRSGGVEGLFFNESLIDTLRSLFVWSSNWVHGYTISNDNQGAPAFELSVVDRVLDVAVIDTTMFVATGKGTIRRYRIYDDFSLGYRTGFGVSQQAREITTHDGKLLVFSGTHLITFAFTGSDSIANESSVSLPFSVEASSIYENRLVGVGQYGFVVIDLSYEEPVVLDYCYRSGHLVATNENLVAVSNGDYVFIYDIRDIVTDVPDAGENLPDGYALSQNYPNPFNPSTTIQYSLPERSDTRLVVYNILGRSVVTLVDGMQAAGTHTVQWNGENESGDRVASGVYFYRLETDHFTESKKMILLK